MVLEYVIVGGCLKIQKNVFIQELLSKESSLRALLNWKTTKDFSIKHPMVSELGKDNIVNINFSSETSVNVGEPLKEFFCALKAKYREKIKGRIACRVEYSMFGGIFTYEIDLNSDDDSIEYINN